VSWSDWVSETPPLPAGRWEQVGGDYYTCVPPPGCAYDPVALAAIHEFDPGVLPIWRIQLWRVPGFVEPRPFAHAGIARISTAPQWKRTGFYVRMPQGAEHRRPNFLECFFEGAPVAPGGPGAYQAFGWAAYYYTRSKFGYLTVRHYDQLIERKKQRYEELRRKHREELDYRRKQIEPYLMRKAATLSRADWERYVVAQRIGVRAAGLRQPKPFVHVRGVAPLAGITSGSPPPKE
jgi:hypothetical protein